MYTHTHTRIRNYVMVGADLPPPGSYRVKVKVFKLPENESVNLSESQSVKLSESKSVNLSESQSVQLSESKSEEKRLPESESVKPRKRLASTLRRIPP